MKHYTYRLPWLSLVEVLIAIAVFAVGILSIAYLVINNVWLYQKSKLKTTATMLAKEWIEIVYNRRDTNIKKWWLRNCLELEPWSYAWVCKTYFHDINDLGWSSIRMIDTDTDQGYRFIKPAGTLANNSLYLRPSKDGPFKVYTSFSNVKIIWTSDRTPFVRTITFQPVYLEPEWKQAYPDKILKVTSTVYYKKWVYSGSVVIQSFIWDTLDTIPLDYFIN